MKKPSYILKPTQNYLTASASIFHTLLKSFGVLLVMCFMGLVVYADELPKSLQDAVAQVQTEEAEKAFSVLSRYAYTDNQEQRLVARTALAQLDREARRLGRAASWVEEYSTSIDENFLWPRAAAFIEAARISFDQGRDYEAVSRLNTANEQAEGLTKVATRRALSELSEAQPDLQKALDFEKDALLYGQKYFKRKLISETAGLEPPKHGFEIWTEWQLEIENRIAELERLIKIESYGLDYVLYYEAQELRKAAHPLAMDFTNVSAAFKLEEPIKVKVPGADYEKALEKYALLIEGFKQNPYAEASKLYSAVCWVHIGDTNRAIRDLKSFYSENPDGLYRGEALKILGDMYLFNRWDQANAREAYERATRWFEAMKTRTRVLQTYLVPEKSQRISQPPATIKMLTKDGFIRKIKVPDNALVNRVTADWYLDSLRAEVEWKLGFIGIINDDWDQAFVHFDRALIYDTVVKNANDGGYFNEYHRLKVGRENKAIMARADQLQGLSVKEKAVIQWADFQFILTHFEASLGLNQRIQIAAERAKREVAYTRAVYGEMFAKKQLNQLSRESDLMRMHNLVLKYPNSPSAAPLLERCAYLTDGDPLTSGQYLEWIYTQYPKSDFAVNARYNEILQLPWEQYTKRLEMMNKFKKDFPKWTGYHTALDSTDTVIRKHIKENYPNRVIY